MFKEISLRLGLVLLLMRRMSTTLTLMLGPYMTMIEEVKT